MRDYFKKWQLDIIFETKTSFINEFILTDIQLLINYFKKYL